MSPVPLNNPTSAPRYGTVIPNRIFVGGIDFKVPNNACNIVNFLLLEVFYYISQKWFICATIKIIMYLIFS